MKKEQKTYDITYDNKEKIKRKPQKSAVMVVPRGTA